MNQAVGFGIWERPEQDRSDDRDDGRIGAETHSEGQDYRQRVRAVLPEHAPREHQILPDRIHGGPYEKGEPGVPDLFASETAQFLQAIPPKRG